MSLVYAAILIGVLIFIHEFGHFIVAKLFDVKVIRFSIGFGPKIASYTKGETEYAICALPLGGYVLMLGSDLESVEDVPEEDRDRTLQAKPIWQRSLVTLAGPAFNLVLPVIIYFVVTVTMASTTPPSLVGDVFAGMPAAAAGLEPGDRIVEIQGDEITYWNQVIEHITPHPGEKLELKYERDGVVHTTHVVPQPKSSTDFLGLNTRNYGLIGIHSGTYGPTLGIVRRDTPAARAGLHSFDRVLTIDGKAVTRYDEVERAVRKSGGKPLKLVVFRRQPIDVGYGEFYSQTRDAVTVTPQKIDGKWSIGIRRAEMFVADIQPHSPAARAGLQVGDEIVSVDGDPFSNWRLMNRQIENEISEKIVAASEKGKKSSSVHPSFHITYLRQGTRHETTLEPKLLTLKIEDYYRIQIGWGHIGDLVMPDAIDFPLGPRLAYATKFAFSQTWEFIRMTVMGFVRMAQGRLSLSNVGGPIMIGELAAQAGQAGWDKFLEMMALISINLGIINLLPIPILDGGNLMLYALEAIKRGPLSFRTRQIAAYVGFTLIVMLIVLAFKNDIERQWDNISEYVNEI